MKLFNYKQKNAIKNLEEENQKEIKELKLRVWKLENPERFRYNQEVYCKLISTYEIIYFKCIFKGVKEIIHEDNYSTKRMCYVEEYDKEMVKSENIFVTPDSDLLSIDEYKKVYFKQE